MASSAQHINQWKPFSLTHITYPIISTKDKADIPLPATIISLYPKLLALLSLTPPFGVCALVAGTILYKDVVAAYILVGSFISTASSAILKRCLQHPRPPRYDDDEDDDVEYGMPSNHSCFAWFCATFVILYVLRRGWILMASSLQSHEFHQSPVASESGSSTTSVTSVARLWHTLHTYFIICASLLVAIGCTYSRVYLGYHTTNQVIAGSIFGVVLGMIWYRLFESNFVRRHLVWLDASVHELEKTRKMVYLGQLNESKDD